MDIYEHSPQSELIRVANLYIEAGDKVENTKRFLRSILKGQPDPVARVQ